MSIASYTFDELMMATFSKGQSVEMYFRSYSKIVIGELIMTKEDFARALSNLNLEWGSNVRKMMEIFDSIDIATNQGKARAYLCPSDIAHCVLLNAGNNVDDILANILIGIHRSLK